jgi:signal transduction histidine kinase
MSDAPIRVLLVEDSAADALLLQQALAGAAERFDVTRVEFLAEALDRLRGGSFDAILLDLFLPDSRGLATLDQASAGAPHVPVIVLTGLDDEATAIEAVRKGAQDFLTKGRADGHLLSRSIRYAMERKRADEEIRKLNADLERRVAERTAVAEQRADQLRALTSELILAEQRERRRLAALLHDHLQQLLYAARLGVGGLTRRVQDQELHASLERVDDLLLQSIEASRSLTVELSPPILYNGSSPALLEWLGHHVEETYGLGVEVEVDSELEVPSEETRILLYQVVRELLFNVVKHAQVKRARVRMARHDDRQVGIVVSDEGVGFDPTKRQTCGVCATGMGLFGIAERLQQVGGRMEVDSAPGAGTRVTVLFPCPKPPRPARGSVPTPAGLLPARTPEECGRRTRDAGKIRVLLADDHQVLREGLTRLLREQPDLELVGQAEDGRKAVELALRTRPDVVVMDVTMPVLSGIEATRRIVAALPGVRVIGLSMHEEEEMANAMLEAGAAAYLRKGGSSGPLIATIRGIQVCEGSHDHQR